MKSAPLLLVGGVGTGKTAHIKTKYNNLAVVEILSGWLPEDILGLPAANIPEKQVIRLQPDWHKRITKLAASTQSKVCLFFDELDKARRDVADALLTLIEARSIGGYDLPDNVDIAAAANPPSQGGGDGISDAMRTRFRVVEYVPDLNEWVNWAESTFEKHPPALAVIERIATGSLPLLDHHEGEAWVDSRTATPRTWYYALCEIAEGNFTISGAQSLLPANIANMAEKIARSVLQDEENVALSRSREASKWDVAPNPGQKTIKRF